MDYAIDVLFKQVLVPMEHRQECHIKIEIFRIQDDEVDLEKLWHTKQDRATRWHTTLCTVLR